MTGHVAHSSPSPEDPTVVLEELRDSISKQLTEVLAEAEFIFALAITSQRKHGFLAADALAAQDAAVREERADEADLRVLSTGAPRWLLGDLRSRRTVSVPFNVAAISLDAELRRELRRLVRRLTAYQDHHGISRLNREARAASRSQLPAQPWLHELTGHLRRLVMAVDAHDELLDVESTLATELTTMRVIIDGRAEKSHLRNATCPWCGRNTLVVHWVTTDGKDEHVVRCEKAPRDRFLAPCTCPDPVCACKVHPVAHRHTWHLMKPPTAADSGHRLAQHLQHDRLNNPSKEPR